MKKSHLILSRLMLALVLLATAGITARAADRPLAQSCETNDYTDSKMNADGSSYTPIRSHTEWPTPTYGQISTRYRADMTPVELDYMLFEAYNPATQETLPGKALLILIAGGQMYANITGSGTTVESSSGNFVVRSAHLFARQGYRVVVIDQPSDMADWNPDALANGVVMDRYRVSPAHAVDLALLIRQTNLAKNPLPVVLVGTSRGAISAVAQTVLADAVVVSSPVTSDTDLQRIRADGSTVVYPAWPVGSTEADPAAVSSPAQVMWHEYDRCTKSPTDGAWSLAQQLDPSSAVSVIGGGEDARYIDNPCHAYTHHGFLGIENCAVTKHTQWLDNLALHGPGLNLPSFMIYSNNGSTASLDLSAYIPGGGSIVLPHAGTVLGGNVVIRGRKLKYTPPAGLFGTVDTFAIVIRGADGSVNRSVVYAGLM